MNRNQEIFEILHTQVLYRGPVFDVRKDDLRLPSGRIFQIDVVDHREAVTIIPIDHQGMVWFIRQYRHPVKKILLELPAGVTETGESPEVSARREIREEIGMSAGRMIGIGGFYLAPGYSTEYMHIYLATDLQPDPLPGDEDEFISIVKFSAKESLILVENGQLQDSKSLIALTWARPHFIRLGLI
jgi:ADP-ribose pyrophosphatase